MKTTKAICVWLDTDSDAADPVWIVSEDAISLPSGRAETSHTIRVCSDEIAAMLFGRTEAAKRGLPLYRNPSDGSAELAQPTDEQILAAAEEAFEAAAEAGDGWADRVDEALRAICVAVDAEKTREEDEDGFGPVAVLRDGRRIWRAETDGTFSLR